MILWLLNWIIFWFESAEFFLNWIIIWIESWVKQYWIKYWMDHFLAKFKHWIESDRVSNTSSFLWFEYRNILQDVCLFKSVTGKKSRWAWEFRIWPTSHFASTSNWSISSTQILFYHPSNQLNSCKKPTTNTWGLQFWFQFLTKEPQLAGAGKQSNFLKSWPHKFHLNKTK